MSELAAIGDIFDIHRAFAATPAGETLAGRIRYEPHNQLGISNDEWVHLLGPDVNNLTHMTQTYALARAFTTETERLEPGTFTPEEEAIIHAASISHDQGEASERGDVNYNIKTNADEVYEYSFLASNQTHFLGKLGIGLQSLAAQAREEAIFDKTTKTGEALNVIECVGYYRTALRSANHIDLNTRPELTNSFGGLTADVLGNITEKLIAYAEKYAAVNRYLRIYHAQISKAFQLIRPEDFEVFEQPAVRKIQFAHAHLAWEAWIEENDMDMVETAA